MSLPRDVADGVFVALGRAAGQHPTAAPERVRGRQRGGLVGARVTGVKYEYFVRPPVEVLIAGM